jgi:hypothetical protein
VRGKSLRLRAPATANAQMHRQSPKIVIYQNVMANRNCENCGKAYRASRSTSRFCSTTCRVRACAKRKVSVKPPLTATPVLAIGIDPDTVDPRWVLAAISVDPGQPGAVRVAAAKALLCRSVDDTAKVEAKADKINRLAAAAMAARRLN